MHWLAVAMRDRHRRRRREMLELAEAIMACRTLGTVAKANRLLRAAWRHNAKAKVWQERKKRWGAKARRPGSG